MAEKKGVTSIFTNTLAPNPVTSYTLFRGVTDYTNLAQFDLYETGYSFLVLLQIPYFMERLQEQNEDYDSLITNYRHIIEYEFRGAQGIEDITGETSPLQNGITDLNIITKVTEQGGSSFSMNYFERSGSVITKTHELFLRGVKDPKTQVKRYNGLLTSPLTSRNKAISNMDVANNATFNTSNVGGMVDKGYQYEIYNFLLMITDNSALNIEKAYILASCQPALANTSIYNVTRGEIQFSEMAVQFNGIPLPGRVVNKKAQDFLNFINTYTCFDEMDFGYQVLEKVHPEIANTSNILTAQDAGSTSLTGSYNASEANIFSKNSLAASKVFVNNAIQYKADPAAYAANRTVT